MAQIKTYARLKPSKKAYSGYDINKNVLTIHIPDNKDFLSVGQQLPLRSSLSYDIMFTDIFKPEASQEEVFDGVAKSIIQNFLNGYNGTIFAYGQTGTGKTYTVEGNTTRYSTRGLATRALSMIYQQLENRSDEHISVYLSYLEIYQEVAYDLLNPASRSLLPVAPFAKVTVVEGPQGSCILRGLSLHLAANEEIAQMLLLQGQVNRKVAETPVNQRSSRSHAVFTVYLQVRKHDSEVLVNSKLHLVDLAGSERVSKTGVDGQQLTEAKSINLSLHHLETVIIALQTDRTSSASGDKSRGDNSVLQSRSNTSLMSGPSSENGVTKHYRYVPYRNSLLTMVLKDSLGGNCLTAMIATISMEAENLGESISTCRFAQRVARIANNAKRNEEVDDKTLIKRLKHKVAYLENQVALLRAKGKVDSISDDEIMNVLTEEDRIDCAKIMDGFLQGVITDPVDAGICDQCRFRECLHLLKHQYLSSQASVSGSATPVTSQHKGQLDAEPPRNRPDHLMPNNPHRDSGDHVMSTVTPATSNISSQGQRPRQIPKTVSSGVNVHASTEYFNLSDREDTELSKHRDVQSNPETKSSEIDQFLDTCTKEKYPSPYERKRVKEIKKLNRKLAGQEREQHAKEEQLLQLKQDTMMQEILATENSLRLKVQVAGEQVADQHAYLLQLKHIQADPDLINKERLVEKQLLKRQAKFQEKLERLMENKEELEQALLANSENSQANSQGSPNKKTLEEKFGQYKRSKGSLNTRQVYDMLKSEEKKQQKESMKMDREKAVMKTKQLAIKEAATLEKLRELKQMLRMSQQQGHTSDYSVTPTSSHQSAVDNGGIESTESNNTLSMQEPSFNRFQNCDMKTNPEMDKQLHKDQTWTHSPKHQNANSSWSKTLSLLPSSTSSDAERSRHMQAYLEQVLGSRLCRDAARINGWQKMQESPTELQKSPKGKEGSSHYSQYSNSHGFSPQEQGNTTANASEQCNSASHESVSQGSSNPDDIQSLHDLRHSHKFAFDERSSKPGSQSTPTQSDISSPDANNKRNINTNRNTGVISRFNSNNNNRTSNGTMNKDQTFTPLPNFQDYNTNSSNVQISDLELTDAFEPDSTSHVPESDRQLVAQQTISEQHSGTSGALRVSDLDPAIRDGIDEIPTRDNEDNIRLQASNQGHNVTNNKSNCHLETGLAISTSASLDQTQEAKHLSSEKSLVPHNEELVVTKGSSTLLMPSEYINSMSSQDRFDARKMGLSSRTFESALSHMLDVEEATNVPNLPYEVDPYEKFSRNRRATTNQPRYRHRSKSPPRSVSPEKRIGLKKGGSSDTKLPVADSKTAWGPDMKNASIADRLAGLLDGSDSQTSQESATDLSSKYMNSKTSRGSKTSLDPFQARLAEYKRMEQLANDDDSEDDSFFGLQPERTKITALKPEEGEKTYMSAVAAERARVAKIRKARESAEIIQRCWRAFQARQKL